MVYLNIFGNKAISDAHLVKLKTGEVGRLFVHSLGLKVFTKF